MGPQDLRYDFGSARFRVELWGILVKKVLSLGVAALLGLLAIIGLAPAAQAYPEVVIDLTAQPTVLYGGETFTATATANVTCDWTLEWNGDSRDKAASNDFTTVYTAPAVTEITKIPLHGTCVYELPDGATPVTGRAVAGPLVTWKRTIMITVLPRGSAVSPPGGGLPNTGGPDLWILLVGLGLVGAGTVVMLRARRKVQTA
jgi:LPXTG-motif cell wall-anchored protein